MGREAGNLAAVHAAQFRQAGDQGGAQKKADPEHGLQARSRVSQGLMGLNMRSNLRLEPRKTLGKMGQNRADIAPYNLEPRLLQTVVFSPYHRGEILAPRHHISQLSTGFLGRGRGRKPQGRAHLGQHFSIHPVGFCQPPRGVNGGAKCQPRAQVAHAIEKPDSLNSTRTRTPPITRRASPSANALVPSCARSGMHPT